MAWFYYFGCISQPGHYLWLPGRSPMHVIKVLIEDWPKPWGRNGSGLDGEYPPPGPEIQSLARVVHVDGWTVLAMWDRSVDRRGKCNSNFVTKGEFDFSAMCALAAEHFPSVWKRINNEAPVVEWTPRGAGGER